eukprot:762472-Hanusia_phi.AAC.3
MGRPPSLNYSGRTPTIGASITTWQRRSKIMAGRLRTMLPYNERCSRDPSRILSSFECEAVKEIGLFFPQSVDVTYRFFPT